MVACELAEYSGEILEVSGERKHTSVVVSGFN